MQTCNFKEYSKAQSLLGGVSIANSQLSYNYSVYPKLAPSRTWWVKGMNKSLYIERYSEQLSRLDAQKVWDEIHDIVARVARHQGADPRNVTPTLLCHEGRNEFCHRRLVAQWFESELGFKVSEVRYDKPYFVEVPGWESKYDVQGDELVLKPVVVNEVQCSLF